MRRRLELGLRVLWAIALVVTALGCQSQRSGTIVDWFMSAVKDPNGQGEGPLTGSTTMTPGSQTLVAEISGVYKYAGDDNAESMSVSIAGQASTSESVRKGEWTYERTNLGPWVRSARKPGNGISSADLEAAGGVVDLGLENHFGRALHHLEIKDPSAISPEALLGEIEVVVTDLVYSWAFWAEADGTPAGITVEAGWKQQVDTVTTDVATIFEVAFESHSGVTIDVPEGTAEPSTEPYSSSDDLSGKLAAIETLQGRVYGSYKVGDTSRSLNGSVQIAGGNTEIHITAGLSDKTIWSEIVAGGNRYVSRDDKIWVNRGKKTAPTLLEVLKAAATDRDAGEQAVGGKTLRCIVSPADSLDAASAFGIDMFNVSGPRTQFRVWVDTSGDPAGFGATLLWGEVLDGTPATHSLDIDVLFEEPDVAAIAAPKNPWQWIVDEKAGIAFALPSQFKKVADKHWGRYVDSRAGIIFAYQFGGPGENSAKQIAAQVVNSSGAIIETRYKTTLDGQTGETMLGQAYSWNSIGAYIAGQKPSPDGFIIAVVVPRGPSVALFYFSAPAKDKKNKEILSDQIYETVQFLR